MTKSASETFKKVHPTDQSHESEEIGLRDLYLQEYVECVRANPTTANFAKQVEALKQRKEHETDKTTRLLLGSALARLKKMELEFNLKEELSPVETELAQYLKKTPPYPALSDLQVVMKVVEKDLIDVGDDRESKELLTKVRDELRRRISLLGS